MRNLKPKVLAFNSSPRKGKGNTALILDPFLEGMRESGAEVELFYNDKLKVKPCTGCFNCWLKTPGVCSHKDDMQWLLPKMRDADVIVYATPVYSYGMTGQMKNLIDRIAETTNTKRVLVEAVVQQFFDEIIAELAKGNRLEFRDFGVFETKTSPARMAQNPRTMEKIKVPAKRKARFRAGRVTKERLNRRLQR